MDFDEGVEAAKNYVLDYLNSQYEDAVEDDQARRLLDDLIDHFENALDAERL